MKKQELKIVKNDNKREMKVHSDKKAFGMEMWKLKSLLPVLVTVVLMLMSYGLVFAPKISQIKEYALKNKQFEAKIVDINQRRAYIQSIDDNDLNRMQETLLMALPESKDIYFLINIVSDMVSDYNFSVDSISISPGELKEDESLVVKTGGVSNISFNVSLVGPVSKYIDLVDGIENSLPILSIYGLESESISPEFVRIDLQLNTYFAQSDKKIDVAKLTYKDLLMNQEETQTLERINSFRKIEGLFLNKEKLDSGKNYQEYEIRNPFLIN